MDNLTQLQRLALNLISKSAHGSLRIGDLVDKTKTNNLAIHSCMRRLINDNLVMQGRSTPDRWGQLTYYITDEGRKSIQ